MSDIVIELREGAHSIDIDSTPAQVGPAANTLRKAADEIERLEAIIKQIADDPYNWDDRREIARRALGK